MSSARQPVAACHLLNSRFPYVLCQTTGCRMSSSIQPLAACPLPDSGLPHVLCWTAGCCITGQSVTASDHMSTACVITCLLITRYQPDLDVIIVYHTQIIRRQRLFIDADLTISNNTADYHLHHQQILLTGNTEVLDISAQPLSQTVHYVTFPCTLASKQFILMCSYGFDFAAHAFCSVTYLTFIASTAAALCT